MAKHELGIFIKDEAAVAEIPGIAEQQFALLLLRHPHLDAWYEPREFSHTNDEKLEGTRPDFLIRNNKTGAEIFVEITTSSQNGTTDPKGKQRRVMQSVGHARYVVLYREHLEKIQRTHPVDFFDARRMRR